MLKITKWISINEIKKIIKEKTKRAWNQKKIYIK